MDKKGMYVLTDNEILLSHIKEGNSDTNKKNLFYSKNILSPLLAPTHPSTPSSVYHLQGTLLYLSASISLQPWPVQRGWVSCLVPLGSWPTYSRLHISGKSQRTPQISLWVVRSWNSEFTVPPFFLLSRTSPFLVSLYVLPSGRVVLN